MQPKDLGYTERVRTDAVLVPVIVTHDGQFVRGLKQQDFEIVEDGVKQSIASMVSEDAPLDLVLAIDVSGSMEHALDEVKVAVKQLLVEAAARRCSDDYRLQRHAVSGDRARKGSTGARARGRSADAWGGTALYDATVTRDRSGQPRMGPERHRDLLGRRRSQQPHVSRNGDRAGAGERRDALHRRLRRRRDRAGAADEAGDSTPRRTGGRAFFPQRTQDSNRVFDEIVAELANQYVLSYSSTNLKQDNSWRSIKVRVKSGKYEVRARDGYRAHGSTARREVVMRKASGVFALAVIDRSAVGRRRLDALGAAAGPEQPPSFRSGVEVVTVDVSVVDKQGQPLRGLTPADFTVTVAGQPRRVVSAEFIDRTRRRRPLHAQSGRRAISSNDGVGAGRLFAFIVDQNTLELGSARRVANSAASFFSRLTFADRSALMLMPVGPNIAFTWAHDRVRDGPAAGHRHGPSSERVGIRQPRRRAGHHESQP